jgi:hypothetical protein
VRRKKESRKNPKKQGGGRKEEWKQTKEKLLASAAPECDCVSAIDTLPTKHSPPHPECYGTVGCGVWAHLARLDFLPSAGTSLLDYKRGVPVARPLGG